MIWKRVPKEYARQPSKGNYSTWKEILAEEGFHQCVYCAIHESQFGGTRNFHVEHYQPKHKFKKLENDIRNLFYACAICNSFKGKDWPGKPRKNLSNPSYPNPSKIDYNTLFTNDPDLGIIVGRTIAAKYLIEKLYLNRPQLLLERRINFGERKFETIVPVIQECIEQLKAMNSTHETETSKLLAEFASLTLDISQMLAKLRKIRPYKPSDIMRK